MNNLVKGPPLTRQEVLLLIDLIQDHSIIMSKQTNAGCNRLKEKAWQLITEEFNARIKSCPRRPYQLKLKWDNLKKSARRKAAVKNQAEGYYIPTDDVLDSVLKLLEGTSDSGNSSSSNTDGSEDRARPDAMEGRHGTNLLRHYSHSHIEQFKEIVARNKERRLLALEALNILDASIKTNKDVGIKQSTEMPVEGGPSSQVEDDPMVETFSINSDDISLEQEYIQEDEVEASQVAPAPDPLYEVKINGHSSDSSESDEEYASPIKSDIMKQRSRVRERRHSDVVRKNIAIAEYYEAKKMKVYLEIKKLKLEISMSMRNQSDANAEINIKTENI